MPKPRRTILQKPDLSDEELSIYDFPGNADDGAAKANHCAVEVPAQESYSKRSQKPQSRQQRVYGRKPLKRTRQTSGSPARIRKPRKLLSEKKRLDNDRGRVTDEDIAAAVKFDSMISRVTKVDKAEVAERENVASNSAKLQNGDNVSEATSQIPDPIPCPFCWAKFLPRGKFWDVDKFTEHVKYDHGKIEISNNQQYIECWEKIAELNYDKEFHQQFIQIQILEQRQKMVREWYRRSDEMRERDRLELEEKRKALCAESDSDTAVEDDAMRVINAGKYHWPPLSRKTLLAMQEKRCMVKSRFTTANVNNANRTGELSSIGNDKKSVDISNSSGPGQPNRKPARLLLHAVELVTKKAVTSSGDYELHDPRPSTNSTLERRASREDELHNPRPSTNSTLKRRASGDDELHDPGPSTNSTLKRRASDDDELHNPRPSTNSPRKRRASGELKIQGGSDTDGYDTDGDGDEEGEEAVRSHRRRLNNGKNGGMVAERWLSAVEGMVETANLSLNGLKA
ncbi:hypothetical protein BZA05DRAFT_441504 [Tricharina praecox]|uniref:uncharacterized protein n=1 Tax=Tricharina praecox TaxID=43433 RepID=UPI00221FAAA5|nr:uncharacterized protein BZA05DRAFT_441504 [Tricharina praecox]KAI5856863.1 hypothetical protein BZA05DRAFT_441504 [Tricharina praecox]